MITTNNQRRTRCWLGVVLLLFAVVAMAAPKKKVLVINSYDEPEPWANDMAATITMYLAGIDSVGGSIANLDNALISDIDAYNKMVDNVFSQNAEHHPDYIVMLGNFAFTLRDRIKEEWGDIPMLLISRITTFGSIEDNFCSHTEPISDHYGTPLESVRDQYNFTTIIIPDLYKETVDLIARLNPGMQELVYLSTNTYVSRHLAGDIETYMKAAHPTLKFTWLHASCETSPLFHDFMANPYPDKAFLLASWVYEKMTARGFSSLTSNDLRLLPSSKNPIFALRESYVSRGCIGGVYVDESGVKSEIERVIHEMLIGTSMRDLPFSWVDNKSLKLNYRMLGEFGINEALCPPETVFYNKPAGYWEKYLWQTIAVFFAFLLFVSFMWWKITSQNSRIKLMKYNTMFLNNMPVPFSKAEIRYDQQGKVRNIIYTKKNDAFEQLIKDNAIPDNPFLLFPSEFISEKTEQLLHTGENVAFTYHFEKTDTFYKFTLCNVLSNKRERGEIQSVVDIFANNITDRISLESQLRSAARKLQLALSVSNTVPWQWNLKTGIVVFDDMGSLGRTTSRQVINAYGKEEWQISFVDFTNRIHPDDRDQLLRLRENFSNGSIVDDHMQIRMYKELHSDETDWVQIYSAVTGHTDDGQPIVTGTLKVITEQKQQEEDMAKAKEMAEESDRMKSAFLANMSHEIRTPLNAIVGFSNLMADAESDEERSEFKNIINSNTDLLLTLVNDVLDLAKIESNTIDINYAVADINAVLQSVEQSTKLRLNPGVRLNMVLGLDRCMAETDPVRLSQVLINLLTNACKFTKSGSITFGYKPQGDNTLLFYVSDTGIGISKEGQAKIFERFVKLNNFAQGTGLGLSICKRLVEMLGGEMGVVSEGEGKGSRFWFTIPYVPVAAEDVAEEVVHPHLSLTEEMTHRGKDIIPEGDKPLVLVAEDHESNYKLIVHLLKSRYRLVRAVNGVEAVERAAQLHPVFILMDINMPVMNGYEAVEMIRRKDKTVPIIAVTAYAYASDRIKIMNSGFNGYVSKPVNQKALADVLYNIKHGGG